MNRAFSKFEPVIGLEIHVELNTESKMFCSCKNDSNEIRPNVNVCPVCLGHPGTLPVINKEAINKVIKTGLALHCEINKIFQFDRKNYFYPDLPKGYQISQHYFPLCQKGFLTLGERKVKLREIHLEEDVGRLIHQGGWSYVDFNRAGVPLMELVTEPDLRSAREARLFAEEFQLILRYLQVSNADIEKGEMRVEANISIRKKGEKKLGTKVEIKNIGSFKAVEKALEYEIDRQIKVLEKGGKLRQETRGWDEDNGRTLSQRLKEESYDYRYFPEPDLLPVHLEEKDLEYLKSEIPELPQQKRERFKSEYKLPDKDIEVFVRNKDFGEYFEKSVSELMDWLASEGERKKENLLKAVKLCSNYMTTDLRSFLKKSSIKNEDFLITPENFAELIKMIYKKRVNSKTAKALLEKMFATGADPSHILKEEQWEQIKDSAKIEEIVKKTISNNKKAVEDYKKGKEGAFQYLMGQVMADSGGRINPNSVSEILKKFLNNP